MLSFDAGRLIQLLSFTTWNPRWHGCDDGYDDNDKDADDDDDDDDNNDDDSQMTVMTTTTMDVREKERRAIILDYRLIPAWLWSDLKTVETRLTAVGKTKQNKTNNRSILQPQKKKKIKLAL